MAASKGEEGSVYPTSPSKGCPLSTTYLGTTPRPGSPAAERAHRSPRKAGEEEPHPQRRQRGGGRLPELHREKHGQREPDTGVGHGGDEEEQAAPHFLAVGDDAEAEDAEPRHQQPAGEQRDGEREQPGQELPREERVPVDRLGEHAAEGAPVVLAVDGVKSQRDRRERDEETQEEDKRVIDVPGLLRGREDAEEEKGIFAHGCAQRLDRRGDGPQRREQD